LELFHINKHLEANPEVSGVADKKRRKY